MLDVPGAHPDPPALADPALADPALADPVLADPVLADPVLADPVLADPVRFDDAIPFRGWLAAARRIGAALDVSPGLIGLIGEAGSGKSSLLRHLAATPRIVHAPVALIEARGVTVTGGALPGVALGDVVLIDDAEDLEDAVLQHLAGHSGGAVLAGTSALGTRLLGLPMGCKLVHLPPLARDELRGFVAARLQQAGHAGLVLDDAVLDGIATLSGLRPRPVLDLVDAAIGLAATQRGPQTTLAPDLQAPAARAEAARAEAARAEAAKAEAAPPTPREAEPLAPRPAPPLAAVSVPASSVRADFQRPDGSPALSALFGQELAPLSTDASPPHRRRRVAAGVILVGGVGVAAAAVLWTSGVAPESSPRTVEVASLSAVDLAPANQTPLPVSLAAPVSANFAPPLDQKAEPQPEPPPVAAVAPKAVAEVAPTSPTNPTPPSTPPAPPASTSTPTPAPAATADVTVIAPASVPAATPPPSPDSVRAAPPPPPAPPLPAVGVGAAPPLPVTQEPATAAAGAPLPQGAPLHVVLIVPPGDAAAASLAAADARRLRDDGLDVADPVTERTRGSAISYFFAEDSAGAARVQHVLGSAAPARLAPMPATTPPPGTIEVAVAGN